MNKILIEILVVTLAILGFGYYVYSLRQENLTLAQTVADLNGENKRLIQDVSDKDRIIVEMQKQAKLNDETAAGYVKALEETRKVVADIKKERADKEKEIRLLRQKYFADHPEDVGKREVEFGFDQLLSGIRMDSINRLYCKLNKCEDKPK